MAKWRNTNLMPRCAVDNDPDRYAKLDDSKNWNMGPFYVVVSADNGNIAGESEGGGDALP